MAIPNTYPSDGRLTSLQNYTGSLVGTELLMIVSPGNAATGVNYNITTEQLAALVPTVWPSENPNQVFAGPSSGVATAIPTFRALVTADLPAIQLTYVTTSLYTVVMGDQALLIDRGNASGIIVLAGATTRNGLPLFIKDYVGNAATVTTTIQLAGTSTLDGLSSTYLSSNYGWLKVWPISAGTGSGNWFTGP